MRLSDRLRDPIVWTNIVQLLKTVIAAVIAWSLAVHVFGIEQAFLAPSPPSAWSSHRLPSTSLSVGWSSRAG
jgi:hypothetical protein